MSSRRLVRRTLIMDEDDEEDVVYSFKVLLPNGTNVPLTVTNPEPEMPMERFVELVKEEYEKARKNCLLMTKRRRVDWNLGEKFLLESNGEMMKRMVRFAAFKPNSCHIIRLDDGSGVSSTMYENLWDLTPDTDLLKELPENYSFETALADLIDNSLQAVWSCSPGEKRMISVDVSVDRISVFDTGRGMDSSEENAIDKWGKIGGSLHRSAKTLAIGGKPPYLKPFFGMFGYGGPYACMYLGSRTLVSAKTKESKKVYTLQYEQDRSISGKHWKASGGMRDPTEEENKLSPHGSFTKVEIFESEFDMSKIYQLRCTLKDIYFPYIQCDELSKTGRTERPVEFQVNGEDLAEIAGGEVAITNLNSKGEDFSFQIQFTHTSEKRKGKPQEANARLKFVYFPIIQGNESIDQILEGLAEEGCKVSESFQTFGRVSIRRLGRLLPEVRWDSIPFMQRGARASILQKSCRRVKCFIDLDAGFSPTPSKTDLASQNPFSVALRNFSGKSSDKEKDTDVKMVIRREGKQLSNAQLEQSYLDWVMKMHDTHDEEATLAEDEAILVLESLDKKALCIMRDAVRVHKVVKRKEMLWKRGQNIKILKGAYAGVHNGNVYATIDYFLIEGFEDEAGGDTRILCRPIDCPEKEGCKLSSTDGSWRLELQRSLSLPITIIDTGKCLHADADEWTKKLEKQQEKAPSKIDLLGERDCRELNIDGELPVNVSVRVGRAPPQQIVAVIRPACFTSVTPSKKLDQKHIVNMEKEMVMVVRLAEPNTKSSAKVAKPVCSQRLFPTSRKGIGGLYIFSLGSKFPNLFKKAGTYNFYFSIGDSIKCKKSVVVRPSSKEAMWKLDDGLDPQPWNIQVGSCLRPFGITCFDEYENQIQFTSVPSLEVELKGSPGFQLKIDDFEANLVEGGSVLMIKKMLFETGGLDQIRPNYEATLEISAQDKPLCVSIACKLNPGPLKRVVVNNPQAFENLLPGSTVENLILEMFDGFNNHVAEGTSVLIKTDGYGIEDWMRSNRKVDGRGCVDLSGILKVTEGYGKHVSFSVVSDGKEIFRKDSQIEERELRLVTELPESCTAGSNLTDLIFKVTDSDGSMDTSIHHDEKSRSSHTLSVESDSRSVQSGIIYAFVHGSCRVPYLSLPETEGIFSFKVFHSRHPELHVNLEIVITPAPRVERDEIGYSTPYSRLTSTPQSGMTSSATNPRVTPTPSLGLERTPCSQFGVLAIRSPSLDGTCQTGMMDIVQYTESLKHELSTYESQREVIDERLKCLAAEQEQAEQELLTLQASLEPYGVAFPECLSTKEQMMQHIEDMHYNTAASVFCSLYRTAPPPKSLFLSNKGVFGIVALLGSVPSTSLSRVLSAYLGRDTMLALVCKSPSYGPSCAEYLKLHSEAEYQRLQSEAAKLGRSITNHSLIHYLDATRPWSSGLMNNDPQRRLAMVNPSLPNGDPIPGFKDYAVNMIELAKGELDIRTDSGHGLRETLFYGFFGDLQVYETGRDLEAALPYISASDAVSLDGLISKRNGLMYSLCSIPEIHFPVTVTEKREKALVKLEVTRERKRKNDEKIAEENGSLRKIRKKMDKTTKKYKKFTAMADSQDI